MIGMTRLEISYYFGGTGEYIFGHSFMKHQFMDQATGFLKLVCDNVLNNQEVHDEIYKELDLCELF